MIDGFSTEATARVFRHLTDNQVGIYEKAADLAQREPAMAPKTLQLWIEDYLRMSVIDTSGLASELLESALRDVRWREICNRLVQETS